MGLRYAVQELQCNSSIVQYACHGLAAHGLVVARLVGEMLSPRLCG